MKHFRTVALFATIFILLVFPLLIGDPTTMSIVVDTLFLMGSAVSWNIFSGYTGYISLGQATYYGLGAYTLALACQDWNISGGYGPILLVPLAGLVAGVIALPLGWIVLRTRRYTFMVITIAIFFIFQLLAFNLSGITGGATGIFLPLPSWSSDLMNLPFYYVALALLLAVTTISMWIRSSNYGLVLLAIRDDEDRARSLGIRTGWFKLGAYVISAACSGMIGAASIYFAGLVTPSLAFDTTLNINVVAATYLGGVGSVMGPIVGALLLDPFQTYLVQQVGTSATEISLMLSGSLLLLILLFLPEGVVTALRKRRHALLLPRLQAQEVQTLMTDITLPASVSSGHLETLTIADVGIQLPVNGQGARRVTWAPPPHVTGKYSIPVLISTTKSFKAKRLVPLAHDRDVWPQMQEFIPQLVSWRCPNCNIPFLLKGPTCYCKRCGFKRTLYN